MATETIPSDEPQTTQTPAVQHLALHFARHAEFGTPGGRELLILERGEGVTVIDSHGRRHIDGLSALWCAQLGYSFGGEMGEVAARQMRELPIATNWSVAHPRATELADELCARAPAPLEHAFFTSGGSESVETAWKLARQYHVARGEPERLKAIARDTAYHGVTLGALALTGIPGVKDAFGTPAIDVLRVANTNRMRQAETDDDALCQRLLDEIESAVVAAGPETICAFIGEPVQNAGGCLVPPAGYWPGLRELADRYGFLLIADEVITGFGRMGSLFASPRYGARPDLMTLAKGLTSAYAPMGAVLFSDTIADTLYAPGVALQHGLTFGGNPVSAAIALHNLALFDREDLVDHVASTTPYLEERLSKLLDLPIVGDVRGDGFHWCVEMVTEGGGRFEADVLARLVRSHLPAALIDQRLIAFPNDRGGSAVVQLAPPLISDRAVLDQIVERLGEALLHVSRLPDIGRVVGAEA